MASTHPCVFLLELFHTGMGSVLSLCALLGFSYLTGMRVWLRFSCPGDHLWEELTGSTNVDVFAPWSKSCFQEPCPLWQPTGVAVHSRLQLCDGKQLVQAVLFPKLPVSLEALCPHLIPVNTAAGELFKQHLFAWFWETWTHHKAFQSSVPTSGWISHAAMPIILGQG